MKPTQKDNSEPGEVRFYGNADLIEQISAAFYFPLKFKSCGAGWMAFQGHRAKYDESDYDLIFIYEDDWRVRMITVHQRDDELFTTPYYDEETHNDVLLAVTAHSSVALYG